MRGGDGGDAGRPEVAAGRALATLRAIRHRRRYSRRHRLYATRAWPFGRRRYEHLWPFANAWSAVAGLAALPGAGASAACCLGPFLDAVEAYRRTDAGAGSPPDAGLSGAGLSGAGLSGAGGFESAVVPPLGPGGDRYYDDNAWIGLAMIRHHGVTGDGRALSGARQVLDFAASGWDGASAVFPGGIRWRAVPASRTRHTCSTAPTAELGALLFERTGDVTALEWATRAYAWTRAALGGDDGLYLDRIEPDGTVDRTVWSYNQGSMIGAGVLLARASGRGDYLSEALATATASLRRFGLAELVPQGPAFNAIYFRNLFLLAEALGTGPGDEVRALAAASAGAYADRVWDRTRDRRTGRFGAGGSPLNATAPMIEVYALLAGAPPRP